MIIQAFRTKFSGKNTIGSPEGELLPVYNINRSNGILYLQEDGETPTFDDFVIRTHDRGDSESLSSPFYQVVFRIVGEPNEKANCELVLDRDNGNPLKYDKENDLWYQQTMFDGNKRPKKNTSFIVDSINTSGVFKVSIKKNGQLLNPDISRLIQVLPSQLHQEDYKNMLDDMLTIHERLVIKERSSVGMGLNAINIKEDKIGSPEFDVEMWDKLRHQILSIMKIPPLLLKKEYTRMRVNKIRHFDNIVMRSMATNKGAEKNTGIKFDGDINIVENQIIKSFLQLFAAKICPSSMQSELNENKILMETLQKNYTVKFIQRAKAKLGEPVNIFQEGMKEGIKKAKLNVPNITTPRNRSIYLEIKENEYIIETSRTQYQKKDDEIGPCYDLFPFKSETGKLEIGAKFSTRYANVAIQILDCLQQIFRGRSNSSLYIKYESMESHEEIDYYKAHKTWESNTNVGIVDFYGVTSCIMDTNMQLPQFDNYRGFIAALSRLRIAEFCSRMPSEVDYYDFIMSTKKQISKKNKEISAHNKLVLVRHEIEEILNTKWFKSISTKVFNGIEATPLFLNNRYYSEIYRIINTIKNVHPVLVSHFNENQVGVHETHTLYEYWVFYQILNRFMNLGFVIKNSNKSIMSVFSEYIQKNNMPELFTVLLQKKIRLYDNEGAPRKDTESIEIMLGFNCIFGDQQEPFEPRPDYNKFLWPDYFVRISTSEGYHWYFLDAKYRSYTDDLLSAEKNKERESLYQVCIKRYIQKMEDKQFIEEFRAAKNKENPSEWNDKLNKNIIMGAYLIVADIINHAGSDDITNKNRFYGIRNDKINELGSMPSPFPFGSIVLRPNTTDELTTLIEMMFEYKESGQYVERNISSSNESREIDFLGDSHRKKRIATRPSMLNSCWDSSQKHYGDELLQFQPHKTDGGFYKIYVTCGCGSRRYDNYCISKHCRHEIIKHDSGNYLVRKENRQNMRDKWNYICPFCGSVIPEE